jgi:hypothetical protein
MAERRRRPDLPPRWLTIGQAAQHLGHSPSWLTPERLVRLRETGFPRVNPSLKRIDREAIDDWSDRRSRRQGTSPLPGQLERTRPEGAQFADAAPDAAQIHLRKQRPSRRATRPHTAAGARLRRTTESSLGAHPVFPGRRTELAA